MNVNDKTQDVIDDLENANMSVDFNKTCKIDNTYFDIIIVYFDAYSQDNVINGILKDRGFTSDKGNYTITSIGQTENSDPTHFEICLDY